jgi:hypothetical protein
MGRASGVDLGGYAGFFAEVGEVGGEAVAEVDGGGGQAVADQPEALGDAGLGVEVRGELGFELFGDAGRLGEMVELRPALRGGRGRRRLRRGSR